MTKLKAPFPYFGGKSRVASLVWSRLGDVQRYVEPFFGSGAVLLARPHWREGVRLNETINDADGLVVNFWRAIQADPAAVAVAADSPSSEVDNVARHRALVALDLVPRLEADPRWYDAEAAGWWAYCAGSCGMTRRLYTDKAAPKCVTWTRSGVIALRDGRLAPQMGRLAARVAHARIKCGDWRRCVKSPAAMGGAKAHTFGVFLDPPYADTSAQYTTTGNASAEADAWAWAVENGGRENLRICVAGYDDGRTVPDGWAEVAWKASGGFGNQAQGTGRANASRERLWFSPHCLAPNAPLLECAS